MDPLSLFFTHGVNILGKTVQVVKQKVHFDAHVSSNPLKFVNQIFEYFLVIAAPMVAEEVLSDVYEGSPIRKFATSHRLLKAAIESPQWFHLSLDLHLH